MIVMTDALVRLPTLSRDDFQLHWREFHAPLVTSLAETLGILSYKQIHALLPDGESEPEFDGFAQVVFESIEAFKAMLDADEGRSAAKMVRDDERLFIDRSRSKIVWGVEHPVKI